MRLWQQGMIFLARNREIKQFIQERAALSELAMRFVGGRDVSEVVGKSRALKSQGVGASVFYLGEYVEDLAVVRQTVSELKIVSHRLAEAHLDIHISVDPTQIGYQLSAEVCRQNAFELAHEISEAARHGNPDARNLLMLDMEDSAVTDGTILLYMDLLAASLPVALTLQAYLRRSEDDLREIVSAGGTARLVKGAFAEGNKVALTSRSAIDSNYLELAAIMLSDQAHRSGFYPIFATHDDHIIDEIVAMAKRQDWARGSYEFEMLYGVRPELQERLVESGQKLRLYLPFGTDWWPYAARRVGESPRNALFLFRSLFSF